MRAAPSTDREPRKGGVVTSITVENLAKTPSGGWRVTYSKTWDPREKK